MTDSLSIAVHAFASRVLMTVLVDETLLPRLVKYVLIPPFVFLLYFNLTFACFKNIVFYNS